MSSPSKIETAANIATIGVAALLSAVLAKVYLLPAPSPRTPQVAASARSASVGADLRGQLPGIDWAKNGRTLVLAISTTCHFCKESEPFYRRLQQEAGKGVKIVAVLPQPIAEAEKYLSGAGLHVDQVRQTPLGDIGVRGTPTMLLVNSGGAVTKVWTGKLQDQEQEQVLGVLKKGEPHV
jgi:thiol-disulfide isomerase/thioredoxin